MVVEPWAKRCSGFNLLLLLWAAIFTAVRQMERGKLASAISPRALASRSVDEEAAIRPSLVEDKETEPNLRAAAVSRFARFSNAVLRSPLLWGVAIAVGFYSLLDALHASGAMPQRHWLRHPIGYLAMETFFIALAALLIKAVDGIVQLRLLRQDLLGAPIPAGQPRECSAILIARLAALPETRQASYLVRRLLAALKSVERRGAAESLDDELKHLSTRDFRSLWQSYGLVILAVVLLPILGVAGTSLTANDATSAANAQAPFIVLALSQVSVLIIAAAATISFDLRLLRQVDVWAAEELGSHFQRMGTSSDPQVLAVRRMADAVVQVTDRLVQRQVELWQSTIQAAHVHWNHLADTTLEQTQSALEGSLRKVLSEFADRLVSNPPPASDRSNAPIETDSSETAATLKLFSPDDAQGSARAEAKAA